MLFRSEGVRKILGRAGVEGGEWYGAVEDAIAIGVWNLRRHLDAAREELARVDSRLAWDDYRFDVTTPGIGLPQWWYTVWLPVLALLLAARSMQQLVRLWAPPK